MQPESMTELVYGNSPQIKLINPGLSGATPVDCGGILAISYGGKEDDVKLAC
jgi:hypothetical protein